MLTVRCSIRQNYCRACAGALFYMHVPAGLPRDPRPSKFDTAGLGGASYGAGGGLHGRQIFV